MKRLAQGSLVIAALALAGLAAAGAPAGRSDEAVIAGGVIVDAQEQGVDGQVLVFAPQKNGAAGKMQLVASQQVEGGGFSLTAANSAAIARLEKANGGYANLEFVAVGGGFFASRTMARTFTSDGEWSDRDGSSNLGEVILAKGAPGAGPIGKHDRKAAAAGLCTLLRKAVGAPFVRKTVIGELHVVAGMTGSFTLRAHGRLGHRHRFLGGLRAVLGLRRRARRQLHRLERHDHAQRRLRAPARDPVPLPALPLRELLHGRLRQGRAGQVGGERPVGRRRRLEPRPPLRLVELPLRLRGGHRLRPAERPLDAPERRGHDPRRAARRGQRLLEERPPALALHDGGNALRRHRPSGRGGARVRRTRGARSRLSRSAASLSSHCAPTRSIHADASPSRSGVSR